MFSASPSLKTFKRHVQHELLSHSVAIISLSTGIFRRGKGGKEHFERYSGCHSAILILRGEHVARSELAGRFVRNRSGAPPERNNRGGCPNRNEDRWLPLARPRLVSIKNIASRKGGALAFPERP